MIRKARVYDNLGVPLENAYLVERLWPRGVRKDELHLTAWLKDAAPSTDLRKWFAHDPDKWPEFQRRYRGELDAHPEKWQPILDAAKAGNLLLLYSAKDIEHNSAIVLQEYLESKL